MARGLLFPLIRLISLGYSQASEVVNVKLAFSLQAAQFVAFLSFASLSSFISKILFGHLPWLRNSSGTLFCSD